MNMFSSPLLSHEMEQRRRKQPLERAKANHLSRQLQMRLQYARLKIEHGWACVPLYHEKCDAETQLGQQRQTLNEVENLYFHHTHSQKPVPLASAHEVTTRPLITSSVVDRPDIDILPEMSFYTAEAHIHKLQDPPKYVNRRSMTDSMTDVESLPDLNKDCRLLDGSIDPTVNTDDEESRHPIIRATEGSLYEEVAARNGLESKTVADDQMVVGECPITEPEPSDALFSQRASVSREAAAAVDLIEGCPSGFSHQPAPLHTPLAVYPASTSHTRVQSNTAVLRSWSPSSLSTDQKNPHGPHRLAITPGSLLTGAATAGLSNSALTYDSFWSSHSTSLSYRSGAATTPSTVALNTTVNNGQRSASRPSPSVITGDSTHNPDVLVHHPNASATRPQGMDSPNEVLSLDSRAWEDESGQTVSR